MPLITIDFGTYATEYQIATETARHIDALLSESDAPATFYHSNGTMEKKKEG